MKLTLSHAGRWMAVASVVALVGGTQAAASATAPPPALPPGYAPVVDDTGTIAVAIPATWTDVDTTPVADDTGATVPQIAAAPNIESFVNSFDTPGVRYLAFPFTPTPQTLIDRYGLTAGCTSVTVQPYADPVFTGLVQVGTGCGTGAATWNMIAASPATSSHTVVVQVQTATAADQQAFDTVLQSFNFATGQGGPTPVPGQVTIPAPAVPAVPTVPTVPAVPVPVPTVAPAPVATVPVATVSTATTPPAATAPAAAVQLVDDSGLLTVQVPAMWNITSTSPTDAGEPRIIAGTDLLGPVYSAPYVVVIGGTYEPDTLALIGQLADLGSECVAQPVEPFNDGRFAGHTQSFNGCVGTAAVRVLMILNPPSQSTTLRLMITLPSFDEAAVALVLNSLNVTR